MTINYNGTVLNGRLGIVLSNIDGGPAPGQIRLLTSLNQTVGLITLQKPSGVVSNAVLTFFTPVAAPLTLISGQIVAADIEDSTSTVVASGLTVGNSTAQDIVMATTIVSSGQAITMTFGTITGR